jgi:ubiquinone/menaquinone biosynthesis C-methylase UbiE
MDAISGPSTRAVPMSPFAGACCRSWDGLALANAFVRRQSWVTKLVIRWISAKCNTGRCPTTERICNMPTPDTDKWLERVFGASGVDELIRTYDQWAANYDADMVSIGYANPAVAAGLVGRHIPSLDNRILDAGVGTGIFGEVLAILGYRDLSGIDMSDGMLAKARERGVYRNLCNGILGQTLAYANDSFDTIVSLGVFVAGHATPAAFDELIRVTHSGGLMIFTVGIAAWNKGGFRERIESLEADRRLVRVAVTEPYRPMPLSAAEGTFFTRCFVCKVP